MLSMIMVKILHQIQSMLSVEWSRKAIPKKVLSDLNSFGQVVIRLEEPRFW